VQPVLADRTPLTGRGVMRFPEPVIRAEHRPRGAGAGASRDAARPHLVAITIASVGVSSTTLVLRKPVAFIQPRQSAGV
jgi:hypothetical protein